MKQRVPQYSLRTSTSRGPEFTTRIAVTKVEYAAFTDQRGHYGFPRRVGCRVHGLKLERATTVISVWLKPMVESCVAPDAGSAD